jgi:hypothetical protein
MIRSANVVGKAGSAHAECSVGIFWRSASKILLAQVVCWRNFYLKNCASKIYKMCQQNLRCTGKIINPIFVISRDVSRAKMYL